MSVFFGKISASANQEFNDMQIKTQRYYANKGSGWFGTIQINDYCYILSGNNIYFWQALEWGNDKDGDYLQFKDILNGNLPINGNKFRSLNIFKFNSDLMVLTIRQVRNKAFFELQFSKEINIDNLKNISFYNNESNYRKVIIVNNQYNNFNDSDIYLLKDEDKVSLYRSSFFDNDVYLQFKDNLKFLNGNKRNKNTTIEKISNAHLNSEFTSEKLTLNSLYDAFFVEYDKDIFYDDKENKENLEMSIQNKQTKSLNQILYGPPGTGKTYNTINRALAIIDGFAPQNRADAKANFEAYKKVGQIEFVTFHQSYGYEEFVEGIKAKTSDKGIEYKIESGIFKKLSKKAKENYENSQKSLEKLIQEKSLQQKIEQFLNDSLEEQKDFKKTKGGKFKIKDIRDTSVFVFTEDSNYNENILELDIDELFKILDSDIDFKTSRQLAKDVFKINNQRQKDTYYFSMYKEFQKQKFDVVEEEKLEEQLKNYILIIDEINRGNISKIFGEIITLIEPSKRIGADEEIKVKLPYSNDDFGVPSNLYIIGTMNTADRSIALMDTALRRRFDFSEMMPDLAILEEIDDINKINIKFMLEKINKRVEYLYDRDHTIGHAYFMSLKENPSLEELENIFRNKIIPLLQEYFYDDWEKILMVLGDGFVQKSEIKSDIFDYKQDDYLEDEKFVYTIKENFDFGNFK
ncbi:MAG TPA: AAA family ATPase [Sulfurimonas sp.]|uniref:McrB family protein n=1 Tax=Sulfurimonas sp. TaxID=2022749 RepID=UPI002BA38861|nr:AAA family ATPase [Sulfurimonas sp.]HUH41819.1 AAA family ATPase [Sulfurimonas sp.]